MRYFIVWGVSPSRNRPTESAEQAEFVGLFERVGPTQPTQFGPKFLRFDKTDACRDIGNQSPESEGSMITHKLGTHIH